MAVVKLGKELKETIIKNAKNIFKKRFNNLESEFLTYNFGEEMYDLVMADYKHLIAQLPKELFSTEDEMVICIKGTKFHYKLNPSRAWFRNKLPENKYVEQDVSYYSNYLKLKEHMPEFQSYIAKVNEFKEKQQHINEQQANFVNGISTVLDAYSTLAPALKALPSLWDLLPEDTKDKHKEVVERKKVKLEQLDIDLGSITSTIIANKIGG